VTRSSDSRPPLQNTRPAPHGPGAQCLRDRRPPKAPTPFMLIGPCLLEIHLVCDVMSAESPPCCSSDVVDDPGDWPDTHARTRAAQAFPRLGSGSRCRRAPLSGPFARDVAAVPTKAQTIGYPPPRSGLTFRGGLGFAAHAGCTTCAPCCRIRTPPDLSHDPSYLATDMRSTGRSPSLSGTANQDGRTSGSYVPLICCAWRKAGTVMPGSADGRPRPAEDLRSGEIYTGAGSPALLWIRSGREHLLWPGPRGIRSRSCSPTSRPEHTATCSSLLLLLPFWTSAAVRTPPLRWVLCRTEGVGQLHVLHCGLD
jgi:hypothetical protein